MVTGPPIGRLDRLSMIFTKKNIFFFEIENFYFSKFSKNLKIFDDFRRFSDFLKILKNKNFRFRKKYFQKSVFYKIICFS